MSIAYGYDLENKSYQYLPRLLSRTHNIDVDGELRRLYIADNRGKEIEVNIYGKATRAGKDIVIVGESKAQLSNKFVDEFIRKKLKRLAGIHSQATFPILVTHQTRNSLVEKYADEKGIAVFYSYQFRPSAE